MTEKYKVVMDIKRAEEILLEVKNIFDECNVEFFLICGTLLGPIREGRTLPWDGDVDIGVKHEILKDNIHFLERAFLDKGYTTELRTCQYGYARSFDVRKDLIHVCIRDYDVSGDKRFHARIIADDNISIEGTCSVFDKRLFDNLKTIDFLGVKFLVPNPPEDFLTAHYGAWEIPNYADSKCKADVKDSFNKLIKEKK